MLNLYSHFRWAKIIFCKGPEFWGSEHIPDEDSLISITNETM